MCVYAVDIHPKRQVNFKTSGFSSNYRSYGKIQFGNSTFASVPYRYRSIFLFCILFSHHIPPIHFLLVVHWEFFILSLSVLIANTRAHARTHNHTCFSNCVHIAHTTTQPRCWQRCRCRQIGDYSIWLSSFRTSNSIEYQHTSILIIHWLLYRLFFILYFLFFFNIFSFPLRLKINTPEMFFSKKNS